MSTILEKNTKGNIALVRNIEQKQYNEISRQLESVNKADFKNLLSMQLENNKTILHTAFYSGDTQIIRKFLNKVIELKLTTEDIKEFFEKSNNAHKTPLTILLKKPAALKTFLEAVNDTGNTELLEAVFDAKGWVADGQLGPTLVQSINDMEKDQPLKEVLLNKVKDSLGSFIMEQDKLVSVQPLSTSFLYHSERSKVALNYALITTGIAPYYYAINILKTFAPDNSLTDKTTLEDNLIASISDLCETNDTCNYDNSLVLAGDIINESSKFKGLWCDDYQVASTKFKLNPENSYYEKLNNGVINAAINGIKSLYSSYVNSDKQELGVIESTISNGNVYCEKHQYHIDADLNIMYVEHYVLSTNECLQGVS